MNISKIKVAIVCSVFNSNITDKLQEGAQTRLIELGLAKNQVDIFKVPGAIEIPLTAKLLSLSNQYHAIICLGSVIRGDTDHYDYVCQQVSQGCQHVMLEFNIPVIFGVLTTNNEKQAKERVCANSHKGIESADAAFEMIQLTNHLKSKLVSGICST